MRSILCNMFNAHRYIIVKSAIIETLDCDVEVTVYLLVQQCEKCGKTKVDKIRL